VVGRFKTRDGYPHGARQAQVEFDCPDKDTYIVVVSATDAQHGGPFRLMVREK
jgi:hypothetical protein